MTNILYSSIIIKDLTISLKGETMPYTKTFAVVTSLLAFQIAMMWFAVGSTSGGNEFKTVTTHSYDVPFERYCGYLEEVAHGVIQFDGKDPVDIAYLFFRSSVGKPSIPRIIYGDTERLSKIESGRHYDIGVRQYGGGLNFPRRLDVVESCK
ncbi:MAG: hypothetical protein AB201_01155 [Parcubacteria bacterium C7867-006]|nr:MAG: hypothetical protein AB201_01155 [Parcubacteria bacterium C7867-006]